MVDIDKIEDGGDIMVELYFIIYIEKNGTLSIRDLVEFANNSSGPTDQKENIRARELFGKKVLAMKWSSMNKKSGMDTPGIDLKQIEAWEERLENQGESVTGITLTPNPVQEIKSMFIQGT